ncbi:MAG: hypothetical protein RL398_3652 [Planctomycetota bacterium]
MKTATSARRRAWTWFLVTAAALLALLVWLSVVVVGLERDELRARRASADEQNLRLALWRMDSWLAPRLAREALRPIGDFRAFASPQDAWTRGFSKIAADEVLVPSPLLGESPALFPVHFEIDREGRVTSPQVPEGNERDVAEAGGRAADSFASAQRRLEALRPRLVTAGVSERLGDAESRLQAVGSCLVDPSHAEPLRQQAIDFDNRLVNYAANIGQRRLGTEAAVGPAPAEVPGAGPLLPLWLPEDEPMLVFLRRVTGPAPRLQGVLVDWELLQAELTALVADLYPRGARLVACAEPLPEHQPTMLASAPARLLAEPSPVDASAAPFADRLLWFVWGGVLLALGTLAVTLRAALSYGDRRARFASAVTHELRTPLTTFRMYGEMLADGIVTDPQAQREYLHTLRSEADRLSRVVENVLSWSRLEQGRFAARRDRVTVGELLERLRPVLVRRLADAGGELVVDLRAELAAVVVATDEDAVAQILFNLVDNAAKYASGAEDRRVHLELEGRGRVLALRVRDHGPGVALAMRERIFAPFDRGSVPLAENDRPGVGLGLALARGLAKDLGGSLRLVPAERGACFELCLPM